MLLTPVLALADSPLGAYLNTVARANARPVAVVVNPASVPPGLTDDPELSARLQAAPGPLDLQGFRGPRVGQPQIKPWLTGHPRALLYSFSPPVFNASGDGCTFYCERHLLGPAGIIQMRLTKGSWTVWRKRLHNRYARSDFFQAPRLRYAWERSQ